MVDQYSPGHLSFCVCVCVYIGIGVCLKKDYNKLRIVLVDVGFILTVCVLPASIDFWSAIVVE